MYVALLNGRTKNALQSKIEDEGYNARSLLYLYNLVELELRSF